MTASLPHPGQRTPSGQRCWRTSAKHLASSNSSERLTRSDEGMTARAPCATAAADQPPASSQQKPHATATRSPASQHPGSQQEPQAFVFLGTAAFTGVAGELRFGEVNGNTKVSADLDGDARADFQIRLDGLITLTDANFLL